MMQINSKTEFSRHKLQTNYQVERLTGFLAFVPFATMLNSNSGHKETRGVYA